MLSIESHNLMNKYKKSMNSPISATIKMEKTKNIIRNPTALEERTKKSFPTHDTSYAKK